MQNVRHHLRSGFDRLIGRDASARQARLDDRTDDIRMAMTDSLGPVGQASCKAIVRRIAAAQDVKGLWYLRSPLMAALCSVHGEEAAMCKIESLSALFEGMLPPGLASRPSTLGH